MTELLVVCFRVSCCLLALGSVYLDVVGAHRDGGRGCGGGDGVCSARAGAGAPLRVAILVTVVVSGRSCPRGSSIIIVNSHRDGALGVAIFETVAAVGPVCPLWEVEWQV